MFDIATRPTPTDSAAALVAAPFDWSLLPGAQASMPHTQLVSDDARPVPGAQVLHVYALELEDSLATAVILSLFTDRRAGRDAVLRAGVTDRRGWVGDEAFSASTGPDPWGSTLWQLRATKRTADVLARAVYACEQALAWLVRDGIADRVTVTADWVGEALAVRPVIYAPNNIQPVYDVLWATGLVRWAGAA